MTIVGDLQQTTHPAGARDWREVLDWADDHVDLHTLTVTYRITQQTADTAAELLTGAGGDAPILHPIREGEPTEYLSTSLDLLPGLVLDRVRDEAGRVGVVVPDDLAQALMTQLGDSDPRFGVGADAIDAPIAVLTARDTKGLEFDHVFVIDPASISDQTVRGADIYVACTRATQTLHLVELV